MTILYHPTANSGGHEVWEAIQTMVKNITEAMLTSLPNFWRISKSFMEGRFKKVISAKSRPFLADSP